MAHGLGSPGGGGGGSLGGGRAGGGSPGGGRIGSPGGRSGGQRAISAPKPAPTPAAQLQGPPPVANKPKSPEPYRPKTAAPHPSQNSSAVNQATLADRQRTPAPEPLPLATDPVNKRPAPAVQKPVDKPVNNMGAKNDPQKAERKIPKEYLPDRAERNKIAAAVNSPHVPKDKKIEARRAFLEAAIDRKRSEAQEKQQNKPTPTQQTAPPPAGQSSNTLPKPAKRTAHRDGWPKLNQQKEINKNVERSMKEAKDFQELTGLSPGKHDKRQAYRSQIDAKRALNKYGDETKANKIKEARDNKIATETNRRAILNGQTPPIPMQRQGREPAPASRGSIGGPIKATNAQQRQNGHSTAVADRPAFHVAPLAPPPAPKATAKAPPAPTRASPSLSVEQKQKYHATAQTLPAESRRQYYRDMIGGTQQTRQEAEQRAKQAAQWQPPLAPPKPAVSAPQPAQPHVTRRTRPPGENYRKAADWSTAEQKRKASEHARSLPATDTREGRDARRAYYRDTIERHRQKNRAHPPRPSITERMRNAFKRAPAPAPPTQAPRPIATSVQAPPQPSLRERIKQKIAPEAFQTHQPRINEHRDVQMKSFVPHKAIRPPAHKETWGHWLARHVAPGSTEKLDRAKIEAGDYKEWRKTRIFSKLIGFRKRQGTTLGYSIQPAAKRNRISIQRTRQGNMVISPPKSVEGRELSWSRVADQSLMHSAKEHRSNHGVTMPFKRPKPAEMPVRYKHTPPAHRKTFQLSQQSAISAPQPSSIYAPTNQPIGLSQSYQQKQNGTTAEEFYAPRKGRPKRIAAGPRFDDYQDELDNLFPEGVPGKAQPQQQQSNGAHKESGSIRGCFVDKDTFDPERTTHRIGDNPDLDCLNPNCDTCCEEANIYKGGDGKHGIKSRPAKFPHEFHYAEDNRNLPAANGAKVYGRLYEAKKKNPQQSQQKQAHEAENHQMRSSL